MVLATLKQTITDWEVTNTPRLLLGHIYLWCSQLGWSDYSVPLSCRAERDICIWVSRICRPVVVSRRVIYGRASVSTVRHFYRRIMDWSASSVMCPTIASHARTLSLSVRERQRHDTGQKRRVGWTNNLQFTRENSAAAHASCLLFRILPSLSVSVRSARPLSHVSMRRRVCQRADAGTEYWLFNDVLHYYTLQ